jgi:hypothetical protein
MVILLGVGFALVCSYLIGRFLVVEWLFLVLLLESLAELGICADFVGVGSGLLDCWIFVLLSL